MHFLLKARHSVLMLRSTRRCFSTVFGPLNSENTSKKYKSEGHMELKRHVFAEWELKQEGRALPGRPPWDCVEPRFFASPCMSVNDHKILATC